jgi:hypothetical protein
MIWVYITLAWFACGLLAGWLTLTTSKTIGPLNDADYSMAGACFWFGPFALLGAALASLIWFAGGIGRKLFGWMD